MISFLPVWAESSPTRHQAERGVFKHHFVVPSTIQNISTHQLIFHLRCFAALGTDIHNELIILWWEIAIGQHHSALPTKATLQKPLRSFCVQHKSSEWMSEWNVNPQTHCGMYAKPLKSSIKYKMIFIHPCRHLYSASSSGTTQRCSDINTTKEWQFIWITKLPLQKFNKVISGFTTSVTYHYILVKLSEQFSWTGTT